MGYKGQTYKIPCDQSALNHTPNYDVIPPTALVYPSNNWNLDYGGIRARGGTQHVNENAVSGTPRIMGIYDYTLAAGTQFIILATSDGKIYKDYTTTIKTGLTTSLVKWYTFLNFGGTLFPSTA